MQIGQGKYGMQTMNQSLLDLYLKRHISLEQGLSSSSEPDELHTMISSAGGGAAAAQAPARK